MYNIENPYQKLSSLLKNFVVKFDKSNVGNMIVDYNFIEYLGLLDSQYTSLENSLYSVNFALISETYFENDTLYKIFELTSQPDNLGNCIEIKFSRSIDGVFYDVSANCYFVEDEGIVSDLIIEDITKYKENSRNLRKLKNLQEVSTENEVIGRFVRDFDISDTVYWANDVFANLLGLKVNPDKLYAFNTWKKTVFNLDKGKELEFDVLNEDLLKLPNQSHEFEFDVLVNDKVRSLLLKVHSVEINKDKKLKKVSGVLLDVTIKKTYLNLVKTTMSKAEEVGESSVIGIFIVDSKYESDYIWIDKITAEKIGLKPKASNLYSFSYLREIFKSVNSNQELDELSNLILSTQNEISTEVKIKTRIGIDTMKYLIIKKTDDFIEQSNDYKVFIIKDNTEISMIEHDLNSFYTDYLHSSESQKYISFVVSSGKTKSTFVATDSFYNFFEISFKDNLRYIEDFYKLLLQHNNSYLVSSIEENINDNNLDNKVKKRFEVNFTTKEGVSKTLELDLSKRIDSKRNEVIVNGVLIDITEYKNNLNRINEFVSILDSTTNATGIGSWYHDFKKYKAKWWGSKNIPYLIGCEPSDDDLYDNSVWFDALNKANSSKKVKEISDMFEKVVKGELEKFDMYYDFINADGERRTYRAIGSDITRDENNMALIMPGVIIDETEVLKQQVELERLFKLHELSSKSGRVGSWYYDFELDKDHWWGSDYTALMFNATPNEEMKYKTSKWFDSIEKASGLEVRKNVEEKFYGFINGKYDSYYAEYDLISPNGEKRNYVGKAEKLLDDDILTGIPGVVVDITEQKKLIKQNNETLDLLNQVNKAAKQGLVIVDFSNDDYEITLDNNVLNILGVESDVTKLKKSEWNDLLIKNGLERILNDLNEQFDRIIDDSQKVLYSTFKVKNKYGSLKNISVFSVKNSDTIENKKVPIIVQDIFQNIIIDKNLKSLYNLFNLSEKKGRVGSWQLQFNKKQGEIWVSDTSCYLLGIEQNDDKVHDFSKIVERISAVKKHPMHDKFIPYLYDKIKEGNLEPIYIKLKNKDGNTIQVRTEYDENSLTFVDDIIVINGFFVNSSIHVLEKEYVELINEKLDIAYSEGYQGIIHYDLYRNPSYLYMSDYVASLIGNKLRQDKMYSIEDFKDVVSKTDINPVFENIFNDKSIEITNLKDAYFLTTTNNKLEIKFSDIKVDKKNKILEFFISVKTV